MRRAAWRIRHGVLAILLTLPAPVVAADAPARHGMVVTAQHLASDVGLAILKQGGNAVDAAVAVGYAQAVVNPCCGNIGGGGFMLLHLKGRPDTVINFRETAPASGDRRHVSGCRRGGDPQCQPDRLQGRRCPRHGGRTGAGAPQIWQADPSARSCARNPPGARWLHTDGGRCRYSRRRDGAISVQSGTGAHFPAPRWIAAARR